METKLRDLLTASGFRFNKALGQNFITDTNLLNGIVSDSGVTADDVVIEIGTGAGTLTRCLAAVCKKVYSFEVDKALQPVLALSLQGVDNVEVIFRDVLRMKDAEISEITGGTPFKVVANLPYYITTPLIMRFLESGLPVSSLTVMVQKEVADRLTASPGTSDYAAITLSVKVRGDARVTRKVPRTVFYPQPNVDSAVIRIDVDRERLQGENVEELLKLIKASFAMRRKTLVNNLSAAYKITKSEAEDLLSAAELPKMVRGEVLSLEDYVRLSRLLNR